MTDSPRCSGSSLTVTLTSPVLYDVRTVRNNVAVGKDGADRDPELFAAALALPYALPYGAAGAFLSLQAVGFIDYPPELQSYQPAAAYRYVSTL